MMMELKRNLSLASYFSARRTYLHREKIYPQGGPQACRVMASLTASCCFVNQPCLDVLIFHLSFEIRERFSILSPLFHRNRFYFVAAAILFPAFQPGLKFRFDYMGFFSPFARAENPSPV